jgi:hypothetical protein
MVGNTAIWTNDDNNAPIDTWTNWVFTGSFARRRPAMAMAATAALGASPTGYIFYIN